jgi:hypothetical protein
MLKTAIAKNSTIAKRKSVSTGNNSRRKNLWGADHIDFDIIDESSKLI